MPTKDDEQHDHVVIPLPTNFAVLLREALTIWKTQVVNQAVVAERNATPSEAAGYRITERALYDQLVASVTSAVAHRDIKADPIGLARAAIEERRRLFPPPPES